MILNGKINQEIHKESQKEINLEKKTTPSISSSTSSSTSSINIQKSYHKKDVLASVNSTFDINKKAYNQIDDYKLINTVSSSCISFLDNKFTKMNNRNQQFYTYNLELLSKKLRKLLPFNNGLKNHGNTCFMNCILQCLFHTSPICEYIVAGQVERDIQLINGQRYINRFSNKNINNNDSEQNNTNPFILTRSFQRLLLSTWKNTYDSSFSSELKQIIGYLNPTFAGVNQNDSHEFCVWFLDRLSQELTYRIPSNNLDKNNVNNSNKKPSTGSFIEHLVQVEFKSTVVCSTCQYKSSKYETDMMLSIPLPQYQQSSKLNNKSNSSINCNIPLRRSLYIHLILTNPTSIKSLLMNANCDLSENSLLAPFHSKIAVNVHISNDSSYTRESFISYGNTNYSNSNGTVINPNFGDLRRYIESAYQLAQSNLVFLDINNILETINDTQSVKHTFLNQNDSSLPFLNSSDAISIVELNHIPQMSQMPLINIICINVYYQQHNQSKKRYFYGLPFVLLINRDCSYTELCKKVLESQSKLFKDKNILKYNHLAEKFFTMSLVDSTTKLTMKINSTDELPLYAEFIDKALNESLNLTKNLPNRLEHIKLNIEWRSYEDIQNLFKDIDYSKAEFVHRSVNYLQTIDENEIIQQQQQQQQQSANNENQMLTTTTLDDCFDLFTQCEELTDENSWMCPKCKKQTNAYKKLCISSVPPILIIHLKRFFYRSKTSNFKLTTPVWFPVTGLDMSKYIEKNNNKNHPNGNSNSDENEDDNEEDNIDDYIETKMNNSGGSLGHQRHNIYDLFAVCNHKGQNMANGHYTAFCKNPVDTRWYCFDDSACMPIIDSTTNQTNNIFNNGSSSVCTENAYILFYKRRDCMKNEKWWSNYIERSLFSFDEFYNFYNFYDSIEKEQQLYQNQQQVEYIRQLKYGSNYQKQQQNTNQNGLQNQKKSSTTSLRASIKNKFLGSNRNANQSNSTMTYVDNPNDYVINDYSYSYKTSDNNNDFICDREINKKIERDRQDDILKNASSRFYVPTDDNNLMQSPLVYVNSYDEINKPSRLLKQNSLNKITSASSSPAKQQQQQQQQQNESPSASSTTSKSLSSSSSSYQTNKLLNYEDTNNIYENEKILNNEMDKLKLKSNNSGSSLLNYPNDNEYIYVNNNNKNNNNNNSNNSHNQSDFYSQDYSERNIYDRNNIRYNQQQVNSNFLNLPNNNYSLKPNQNQNQNTPPPTTPRQTTNFNNNQTKLLNKSNDGNNSGNTKNANIKYMNPSRIETPI